ncbi:MAG: apolipoprotein N-acyltransferase [Alphaproteobacteria bacterium]|nr:apolipoprotein N-acyltransferase [Alphaproteobacteria bacterium]
MTVAAALDRLAARVRGLAGWRRAAVAIALGVAATAALPPLHAVPFLLPAFAGLAWLIEGAGPSRRAFSAGWWFGLGHFASGLYWISHALLVDAAKFAWMIPLALGGLGAGLGLFIGLAAVVAHRLARLRVAVAFALAIGWMLAEWLRAHVLTGFPWNLIGTAWAFEPAPMQGAAFVGVYGLGAITVALAAWPAAAGRQRWIALGALALVVAAGHGLGAIRLGDDAPTTRAPIVLRLVQPDIAQSLKWDPAERQRSLAITVDLSFAPGAEKVNHVIWPETATLFPLASSPEFMAGLARIVPPNGYLLTGSTRFEREPVFRAWNSLHALDGNGEIRATFDKFHLVPFGEYVPLRGVLPVDRIAPGPVDFSPGPGPRTIRLPGLPPFSPLICYEIIFPRAATDPADRPDWILNITNDAWFGLSAGPYQHFASARFRAIEEGLPVVRVANGGISAIIDAQGRVRGSMALGSRGVLDAPLPPPVAPPPYARFGDWLLLALALGLAAAGRGLDPASGVRG